MAFQIKRSLRYQDFIDAVYAALAADQIESHIVAKAAGELSDHGDTIDNSLCVHRDPVTGELDSLETQVNAYLAYIVEGASKPEWLDY